MPLFGPSRDHRGKKIPELFGKDNRDDSPVDWYGGKQAQRQAEIRGRGEKQNQRVAAGKAAAAAKKAEEKARQIAAEKERKAAAKRVADAIKKAEKDRKIAEKRAEKLAQRRAGR